MVVISNSGQRRRAMEIMVPILRLVLYFLSQPVNIFFREIADLGHRVPNLKVVELSLPHLIPLANYVGWCIMDFLMI